jgi:ADP-ribose pyrophosphatase
VFQHPPWVYVFVDGRTDDSPGFIRIREGDGRPGASVLALRGSAIAVVNVYRRAIGRSVWELPRGFSDEGESSSQTAQRELREETGLDVDADSLAWLGRVAPNSGLLESEVDLYLARVGDDELVNALDQDEVRMAEWMPVRTVLDKVRAGEIVDSFTLAALTHALLRGVIVDGPDQSDE